MATMNHTITHEGVRYRRTPVAVAARKLDKNPNLKWFLVGNKVGPFHFFNGWTLAYHPSEDARVAGIPKQAQEYGFYLDRELGKPIAYLEIP